uniref:Myb-like protein V-like n=1 Tax=Saccoglossus kowalevskii TaxID=10224 RepID=A0ABM0LZG1_SACKO|nr:PREDICTED: myb-like protein V-like [Saccoglossus kowalevskii]
MSMVVDDKAAKKLVQKFETQLNQLAEKEEKQSNEIKTPAAEPAEIETSKDDEKKKSEKENEHQAMSSEVTITVDEPPPTPTTQKPTPDILTSIEESAADHTPKRQTRSKGKNKAGITFLGSTSKTSSLKSKSSKGSIPMEDDSCSDLENDVFVTPAPPSCTVTKKQPSTRKSQRKSKPQKELDVESPVATRRSTRHSSQQKTDAKAKLVQLLSDSDSHADDEPDLNIKRRTRRSKTLSSKSYKV